MRVGVPKEVKPDEYRVAMMPVGVELMVKNGHQVFIETHSGASSGFPDEDYVKAGATIIPTAAEVFEKAEMICKVKEPQPQEISRFRPGQVVCLVGRSRSSRQPAVETHSRSRFRHSAKSRCHPIGPEGVPSES